MAPRMKSGDKEFRNTRALRPFLKELWPYILKYRNWFVPFIVATIMVGLIDAVNPMVWLYFLDDVVTPLTREWLAGAGVEGYRDPMLYYGALLGGLMLVKVLCVFTFITFAGRIEENMIYALRKDMFNKLQGLSFSFYDKNAIGWLTTRLVSDTDRVTMLLSWSSLSLIWGLVVIFGGIGMMTWYSWKLTLAVLFAIPLMLVVAVKLRLKVLRFSREARKVNSEMIANLTEHVNGIELNKVTNQEEKSVRQFSVISDELRRASYSSQFFSAVFTPLVVATGSIGAAMVILWGGGQVLDGAITLGVLAAFFSYARMIFEPVLDITRFYAQAQSALSAGERIFGLINEKPAVDNPEGTPDFPPLQGDIEFREVHFHYVENNPVLENFNLKIRAGESIALVGPTGEGKSTLANLVARFYEPVRGEILIDGIDYQSCNQESLRRQMGIMLQTPHVFAGSIRDNIRYGAPHSDDAAIERVLAQIGARHFSSRLEDEVGADGGNLSTGEKQIIGFARVLLRDPRIIIMDEATSSVDVLAEQAIQAGIKKMVEGRTAIIIAHRLSTVKDCDRILVIKGGRILEAGSHNELMAQKGHYFSLYTRQSREVAV
ncbi:MAG TPA: ABC transporter ATP-binding protein [Calditrichia bacterium]|nr:ABC transporter ATP-binding protein [Calditrichia bacterium]